MCPIGFPDSSLGKESTCNAGDPSSIPESGRSTGEGIGYLLQYSGLEISMDCIVHGVTKSRARLSDFHSLGEETHLHGSWEPVTHLLTMWLDHMKTALLWFLSLVIIIPSGPFQTLLVDMLSSLLVFVETFVFLIWSLPLSSCQGLGMRPKLGLFSSLLDFSLSFAYQSLDF